MDLDTDVHVNMLAEWRRDVKSSLPVRLLRAVIREASSRDIYGKQWGDVETVSPLTYVRDQYVLPYVKDTHTAVEIGPGGGRWTKYLCGFGRLYAVDYHAELLAELRANLGKHKNLFFIKNNGTDFPSIPPGTVSYVFSFGTFVHFDFHLIEAYLRNLPTILTDDANVVIHYSDKTKILARNNVGFAENTPDRMRAAVTAAGFEIREEDTTSMWHSSIIRFGPVRDSAS